MPNQSLLRCAVLTLASVLLLAACSGVDEETTYPRQADKRGGATYEDRSSVFGEGGLNIFGGGGDGPVEGQNGGAGIGVNSFLWRASLDTISFMPLASADPFGGVIITDWYTPPETEGERFKVNVYILGRDLRADGIRASVFRQENSAAGWTDARVDEQTITDLENAILTRARQLRIAGLQ